MPVKKRCGEGETPAGRLIPVEIARSASATQWEEWRQARIDVEETQCEEAVCGTSSRERKSVPGRVD